MQKSISERHVILAAILLSLVCLVGCGSESASNSVEPLPTYQPRPTYPTIEAVLSSLPMPTEKPPTHLPRATRTRVSLVTAVPPTAFVLPTRPPMGLSSTYDKFKDETTVFTLLPDVPPDVEFIRLDFTYKGETPAAPTFVLLSLRTRPSQLGVPRYAVDHDFIFLLDNTTRIVATRGAWNALPGERRQEGFVAIFETAAFAKLAAAKKIEVQFGSTELHLTPSHIADLQAIARRVTP